MSPKKRVSNRNTKKDTKKSRLEVENHEEERDKFRSVETQTEFRTQCQMTQTEYQTQSGFTQTEINTQTNSSQTDNQSGSLNGNVDI